MDLGEDYCSIVVSPVLRGKPVALNTTDGLNVSGAAIVLPKAPKSPAELSCTGPLETSKI